MEENGFFTKHQHGFRKGRSCATQLIEVMEQWTEYLDKTNSIDVVYLDFQKAFDTATQANMGVQSGLLLFGKTCIFFYLYDNASCIFSIYVLL
jgi:hypothetical protein